MTIVSRQSLITELLDRTELIKAGTFSFFRLTDEQLVYRPAPGKWSIAEIFCHLNLALDKYVRAILSRVTLASDHSSDRYATGWLGDWLYGMIMPRPDGRVLKMQTPRWLLPTEAEEGRAALENFRQQCDALDDILRYSASKDLRRIKIPIHNRRMISIRLGDVLRLLVAHNERHLLQAQRVLLQVSEG